ncbi:MAG: aspartate 1-decarboxylase [Gammaproteobacteria bacterium]|nr:MAG: aspartate 1-decarboxylase [Gammaproteobacteria bacterium]
MSKINYSTLLVMAELCDACVTHSELNYEGSCAIDAKLLDLSGLVDSQQIHITNKTQGTRFITYIIRAQADSGTISINGAAAHLANPGDRITISAYAHLTADELEGFKPVRIFLDEKNELINSSPNTTYRSG